MKLDFPDGTYRFYLVIDDSRRHGMMMRCRGRTIGARVHALRSELLGKNLLHRIPMYWAVCERPRYVLPAPAFDVAAWILTHREHRRDWPSRWWFWPVPGFVTLVGWHPRLLIDSRTGQPWFRWRWQRWLYVAEIRRIAWLLDRL